MAISQEMAAKVDRVIKRIAIPTLAVKTRDFNIDFICMYILQPTGCCLCI